MDHEPASIPDESVDFSLLQTLAADRTCLCTDASNSVVVLKKLNDDCLHQQRLHPSIKERLARVRELPHPRLATLRAVVRWRGNACLVWTYLDGESWEDASSKYPDAFPILSSALVETVSALHEMGIVHGSLHGKNIFVLREAQVWLTDVSPYLYTDPEADEFAIVRLLSPRIDDLPAPMNSRLAGLLQLFQNGEIDLRELARALRSIGDIEEARAVESVEPRERYRTNSWMLALVAAALGVAAWIGIDLYYARQTSARPSTFPSLRSDPR